MPIYGDPEKVVREVLQKAKEEADSLVQRAEKVRERRLERAKEELSQPQAEVLAQARLGAQREKEKLMTSAKLEAKMKVLRKKEELVNRVFQQAIQRLQDIRRSPDYPEIISRLIEEAVHALGDKELIVEYDSKDNSVFTQGFKDELANRLNLNLHFQASEIPSGGVIVRSQHAVFDNSFQARLERWKPELREKVLEILLHHER